MEHSSARRLPALVSQNDAGKQSFASFKDVFRRPTVKQPEGAYVKHRWIYLLLPLILLACMVVHVYADYTGPQRTSTKKVRDPENDTWTCRKAGEPPCRLHHPDNPCADCGGSHPSVEQQLYWCGWVADSCGCSPAYKKKTINLEPATVSGSFTCDTPGNDGWCLGGAGLDLAAHEPLNGHTITMIEGDTGLLCDPEDAPDVACSWSGDLEGQRQIAFWAHSSYGDTSEKAFVTWMVDTVSPEPVLSVSGGLPAAGWYNAGPLTAIVTGSDTGSGFASGELSLEGGEWAQKQLIEADGIYSFALLCADTAGNSGTGTGVVRLDSAPPSLSAVFSGEPGENGWFRSGGAASADVTDGLSGVAEVLYSLDDGEWAEGAETNISGEGVHTVAWRAVDTAGNEAVLTQELRIDSIPPEAVILSPEINEGKYFGGVVHVGGMCTDTGSGLARCEVSINGGDWVPVQMSEGSWGMEVDTAGMDRGELVVNVRAVDQAGNTGEPAALSLPLDNTAPKVDLPDRWHFTQEIPIVIRDTGSGIRRAELRINCGEYGTRSYTWNAGQIPDTFTWDRRVGDVFAPPGEYEVCLEAWDNLGNNRKDSAVVVIPSPPTITPTVVSVDIKTPMPKTAVAVVDLPTLQPSPEPELVIPVSGEVKSHRKNLDNVNPGKYSILILSVLGAGILLVGLALSVFFDRRYKALWDVSKTIRSMSNLDFREK